MVRYLLLMPLCLLLQDRPNGWAESCNQDGPTAVRVIQTHLILQNEELLRQELLAGLAFATPQAFPGTVPWLPMQEIGTKDLYPVDFLIHYHPLLFLEMSLEKYRREVTGYTTKFQKRERIAGKLGPPETMDVFCREHPFSVYMHWVDGQYEGQKALYVAGENKGKVLARGAGFRARFGVWEKDVDGDDAKKNGRYTIDQFGIYLGTQRTAASMRNAQGRGALHLVYEGPFAVPQLGNRVCYKFVRTPYDPVEEEGVNELTLFFDKENWLQVGSVLKDSQGQLIAEYYFRDLKLNPEFNKDQFSRAAF